MTKGRVRQVWCAYSVTAAGDAPGLDDFVLFGRELDALRYAAANGMRCKALDFGQSVMEQVRGGSQ